MQKVAIIVIDMLKDFVTGSLKCDRAVRIISNIKNLLDHARNKNIPIIFSNDHHIPTVDKEFKLWGPHAVAGTEGARVIDELKPNEGGYIINKRRYSGFFETDLDLLLRELDIETVVLTGLHTNICVRHTAADAFFRGYKLIIPEDGVEAFTEEDHKSGIDYLKKIYGAEITTTSELIQKL
ncbi:MAG: cysteine hydrolase [Euryarchaeota archaeon]|nr:cysteine hydrolase [Euryarchaeota archaeon]